MEMFIVRVGSKQYTVRVPHGLRAATEACDAAWTTYRHQTGLATSVDLKKITKVVPVSAKVGEVCFA